MQPIVSYAKFIKFDKVNKSNIIISICAIISNSLVVVK